MTWRDRLFRWLTIHPPLPPSRIGPDIRFELHVLVSQRGDVGIFKTNLTAPELAELYPQLLPQIVLKMAEAVPPEVLLETLLAHFGVAMTFGREAK